MEFNAYSMLVDFMWAGIFLFVAKMLREKIKILQSLFVPVSLLAGFIGLALGQNGFGIISFSSQFGSYAGLLIIAVFVSIGLRGFNFSAGGWKTNFDRIGSYYCFRNIGWAFQYAMPIIFAMVVLKMFAPDLNPAFGMLIPAGFQGGHGTAAALGATLGSSCVIFLLSAIFYLFLFYAFSTSHKIRWRNPVLTPLYQSIL